MQQLVKFTILKRLAPNINNYFSSAQTSLDADNQNLMKGDLTPSIVINYAPDSHVQATLKADSSCGNDIFF
jgi:hypothetical protein